MTTKTLKLEIPTFTPKNNTLAVQTPLEMLDNISLDVHEEGSSHDHRSDSIPTKLKTFYSHRSFRQIVLSILSLLSISSAFIGLFVGRIDECACIGFVTSVITLFCPSPLQLN
jgi:hypothetical protein